MLEGVDGQGGARILACPGVRCSRSTTEIGFLITRGEFTMMRRRLEFCFAGVGKIMTFEGAVWGQVSRIGKSPGSSSIQLIEPCSLHRYTNPSTADHLRFDTSSRSAGANLNVAGFKRRSITRETRWRMAAPGGP